MAYGLWESDISNSIFDRFTRKSVLRVLGIVITLVLGWESHVLGNPR